MNHKSWEKVEQVFHTAMELSVAERTPYLQRECAEDRELLSEVESLISSFENGSDFLDTPVFEIGLGAIGKQSQKNLAGATIGFYQLEEKIGAGGMGEVYLAFDTRLNRRVALKFLSESLENDNAAKRQFVKEAQAVAMLEHPNICPIYGIEQSDEHNFIVMQYIEGKTLADSIDKKTIGVDEFKFLARQIVTAVAFAHLHGVIHRDIKPGNIMLTDEGQIKVLDFGLAKIIPQNQLFARKTSNQSSLFSSNELVIGTVSYMSPEHLRGKKTDFRSDIFSLGIVLYELLAKQNPFNQNSQAETIAAILTSEPPEIKGFASDFPESLLNLVEKCLQKNPDDRFQSAAEILVELDNAESANVIKSIGKRRRNFFVKAALAAIILLVVFAAGFFFYNNQRPQRTLAVLPISFENPPDGKEYLADGLTQSIIDKLSNLSDLKVKNEYFTNSYKTKVVEPQTAGKELSTDAVLSGTITQSGDNFVLTTILTRTSDGLLLDRMEFSFGENLTELQENVSTRIAGKIKFNLTDDDKIKLAKKDTGNEQARRLYDLGNFHLKKNGKDGSDIAKAIDYFTQATVMDQNYAKAYAGLANAYIASSSPGVKGAMSPTKAGELAKLAANKALSLDNTSSETYYSLGLINSKYEWDWREAETNFRRALNLERAFIPARLALIGVLYTEGRFDDAIEEATKIKEFDPLSVSSDFQLAMTYYRNQEYEQTDRILSDLLERFPDNNKGLRYLQCYLFLKKGKFKEVTEILEPTYKSDKNEDKVSVAAPLGFAYAKMGRDDDALKIIKDLEMIEKKMYVPAQEKSLIYVGLGDFEKVFEFLDKSCNEKFQSLPGWVTDPIVDEVWLDPRFPKIKECVNL